jgi:hypothetical protein
MTLMDRLTDLRTRLIDSGKWDNVSSDVVEATIVGEAIDRIRELEAFQVWVEDQEGHCGWTDSGKALELLADQYRRNERLEAALREIADFAEQFIGDDEDGDERMYKVHQIADNAIPFTAETSVDVGKPGGDMTCEVTYKRRPDGTFEIIDSRCSDCDHDMQHPNHTLTVTHDLRPGMEYESVAKCNACGEVFVHPLHSTLNRGADAK